MGADPVASPPAKAPAARAEPPRPMGGAMPFGRKPLRTFAVLIALPAFLLYVSTAVLVVSGLGMMADEINRHDDKRTTQAFTAALDSFVSALGDAVADEGTWDEAYLNTVVKQDPAWLDTTWGTTARAGLNYDNVMVTDAAGNIVFGENNLGALGGNIVTHFEAAVPLLDKVNAEIAVSGDGAVETGFVADSAGIAGLAVTSIHRSTPGEITVPQADRRLLWIARHLSPIVLQSFADKFQVPAPTIAREAAISDWAVPIADPASHYLGSLSWTPERPGDSAFGHALLLASSVLFVIGLLLVFGLSLLRRLLLRRSDRFSTAAHAARTDAATGQLNEFGLLDVLADMISRTPAPKELTLAYLGVDNYDDVHNEHGPEVADELMRKIGEIVAREAGRLAVTGRVGTDAYAMGATGPKSEAAIREASEKVARKVAEPIDISGIKFDPKVSIGISTGEGVGAAASLRTADQARRSARAGGTTKPVVYAVADDSKRAAEREAARKIRNAIEREQFELEYQPVFDLRAQTLIGVESLLRLKIADGTMAPAEFLATAEAEGLLHEIGLLAVRRACREILPFKGLMLGVNIGTGQFDSPTFVEQFHATIASVAFPPQRLQVEIDQSLLAGQPHRAKGIIDELREQGMTIALDDFVVGQSSIGYLRQYKLDRVKLARSLVSNVDVDDGTLALVQTTVNVARSSGLAITALGVERKEQVSKLLRLGCTEFQGYLFAKPMSLDALKRLIADPNAMKKAS